MLAIKYLKNSEFHFGRSEFALVYNRCLLYAAHSYCSIHSRLKAIIFLFVRDYAIELHESHKRFEWISFCAIILCRCLRCNSESWSTTICTVFRVKTRPQLVCVCVCTVQCSAYDIHLTTRQWIVRQAAVAFYHRQPIEPVRKHAKITLYQAHRKIPIKWLCVHVAHSKRSAC